MANCFKSISKKIPVRWVVVSVFLISTACFSAQQSLNLEYKTLVHYRFGCRLPNSAASLISATSEWISLSWARHWNLSTVVTRSSFLMKIMINGILRLNDLNNNCGKKNQVLTTTWRCICERWQARVSWYPPTSQMIVLTVQGSFSCEMTMLISNAVINSKGVWDIYWQGKIVK